MPNETPTLKEITYEWNDGRKVVVTGEAHEQALKYVKGDQDKLASYLRFTAITQHSANGTEPVAQPEAEPVKPDGRRGRTLSPEARKRISESTKARWAAGKMGPTARKAAKKVVAKKVVAKKQVR